MISMYGKMRPSLTSPTRVNLPYFTYLYFVKSFLLWHTPVPKPFHCALATPFGVSQNWTELAV